MKWINPVNFNEQIDDSDIAMQIKSAEILKNKIPNNDDFIKESDKQKLKDQAQARIMSHFIQHPDENVLMSMKISRDTEKNYEIIEFQGAQFDDTNLDSLSFSWLFKKWLGLIRLKADGTWDIWEEFTKELAIDKKTNTMWMLFVWKKWLKINKVEFDDIAQYETPYETYFAYNKNWITFIKPIKNSEFNLKLIDKDNPFLQLNIGLDKLSLDGVEKAEKDLMFVLKEAMESWLFEEVLREVFSWADIPENIKDKLKEDLRKMFWSPQW